MWKLWRVRIYARVNSGKGTTLIGHEEGIGGWFGQDVEYRVAWSQFSPHQPDISPLMRAKYFQFQFQLLPLWKKVVGKQIFTLFYCNFFDISSNTTYWGLLYIHQSFQSRSIWLAKVQWLVYNSFISTVSHNFFTPVFGTWWKNKNSGCTIVEIWKKKKHILWIAHLASLWEDHLPPSDHQGVWLLFRSILLLIIIVIVISPSFVLVIRVIKVHFPLEPLFHFRVPADKNSVSTFKYKEQLIHLCFIREMAIRRRPLPTNVWLATFFLSRTVLQFSLIAETNTKCRFF